MCARGVPGPWIAGQPPHKGFVRGECPKPILSKHTAGVVHFNELGKACLREVSYPNLSERARSTRVVANSAKRVEHRDMPRHAHSASVFWRSLTAAAATLFKISSRCLRKSRQSGQTSCTKKTAEGQAKSR